MYGHLEGATNVVPRRRYQKESSIQFMARLAKSWATIFNMSSVTFLQEILRIVYYNFLPHESSDHHLPSNLM